MSAKKIVNANERNGELIGYARVSTPEQKLDVQIEALRNYGVETGNIFSEKASGASNRRPRLEEAMAKADAGDVFVVWKLDRFGRSIVDLLQRLKTLQEKGVEFVSISDGIDTTTSTGRLMMHVLASIAQFERDLISDRTRAGMRYKMEHEGYVPGPKPKLEGEPIKYAQRRRTEGAVIPEIVREIKEKFGISVSRKTVYNQTIGPTRTLRKQ